MAGKSPAMTVHGIIVVARPELSFLGRLHTGSVLTSQMLPTSWPGLSRPSTPLWQAPMRGGSRLFIDVLALGFRAVSGAPGRFQPQFHMHCQLAVRPVEDSLPHYKSRPARFGGSDDTVDW
jgi:hypothetical protein